MKRYSTHRSLNVYRLELTEWPYGLHTHNFYEIILVNVGQGMHTLNNVSQKFETGDIFFLTPDDEHYFELKEFTVLTYIKFTEQFFLEKELEKNSLWFQKISRALYNPNSTSDKLIKNEEDMKMLFYLAGMLHQEYVKDSLNSKMLIVDLFSAIISILVRNIEQAPKVKKVIKNIEQKKISAILGYIRQHIHSKKMLAQKTIAEKFNLAPEYVSIYLKRNIGMGLQQLITETRLQTAETLLKQSDLSIKQIADKLDFIDSSHMNKIFKKYRKKNPIDYRKS